MSSRWQTPVSIPNYSNFLQYGQSVVALGSCFAEYMGERLAEAKFDLLLNPFGILYNPLSIVRALERMRTEYRYQFEDLTPGEDLWFSFDHHGRYAAPTADAALEHIRADAEKGRHSLLQAHWLLITMGSAHVWTQKSNKQVVANCHKQPAHLFERHRLSVSAIVDAMQNELFAWKQLNPDMQVVLTISPVRYLRDGLIDSQRSKAALIIAADQLCTELPFVHYFPAYEIVLDELRDYRFYGPDLVHPSEIAVDYVWEKWINALLHPGQHDLLNRIQSVVSASRHRPLHPMTAAHQQFLRKQLEKIEKLETSLPFIDFSSEKARLSEQKL